MSDTTKFVGGLILFLVAILGLDWIITGHNFFLYQYFAPKQAAVERSVYEQTKAYKQGSKQRLGDLCLQVEKAEDGHKPMIRGIIAHEFVEWELSDVPGHLQSCLVEARKN